MLDLANLSPAERATKKATEIAKIRSIPRNRSDVFKQEIEILSIQKIDGGVSAYVVAWDSKGKQLGFGKRGDVEIERFNILNPPILVEDPAGDIVIEEKVPSQENPRIKVVQQSRFREDPQQALIDSVHRIASIHVKPGKNIVRGRIGNTVTTAYSVAGGDGGVYAGGDTWAVIRAATTGTNEAGETTGSCYSEDSGDVWMERVFLPFDTSAITDTDTIDSATIQLRGTSSWDQDNDAQAYMAIVQSTQASATSLANGDYDALGATAFSDTIDITSWNTGGFNTFTLNASGLANISKTGYSLFALREGHDLENSPVTSSAGTSGVVSRMANYTGTSSDPIISVTHSAASTNVTVTPSVISGLFSVQAPTITAVRNVTVTTSVVTGLFSVVDPSIAVNITASVSVIAGLFSINDPTVSTTRNPTVTPSVVAGTFSVVDPTISTVRNVTVETTVVAGVFSVIDATVALVTDVTVLPSVVVGTFSLPQPRVISPESLQSSRFTPKVFVYKVYSSDGSYVTTWSDDVISTPRFSTAINAGPGEMQIRLARDFESFGEEDDVTFNNRVDCYVFDSDTPNGMLLYRGFISLYAPILESGREYVLITLLPYISSASRIMLREIADGATEVPFLSYDPSDIFRGIVSRAVADGLIIETSSSSIDDTETVVSYTYNTNTVKEALDKAIELAPDGWYWRVDPDSMLHFHQKPTTVTHDLLIGKHIETMRPEKRIENIINRVYFTGGGSPPLYEVYSRQSSIDAYGLRAVKIVDQRVTLSATAQTVALRVLDESESPEVRTKLTIVDNNGKPERGGYDIESIKVGDTLRIKNLQYGSQSESLWDVAVWDTDVWDQTLASVAGSALLVVKTTYNGGNTMEVETSSRFPVVSKRIEDINRNLQDSQTVNNPSSPS